jgi:hypothetical protein
MSEKDPYSFYKKKTKTKDQPRKTYQEILDEVNSTANAQKRQSQPTSQVDKQDKAFSFQPKKIENAPVRFTDLARQEPQKFEQPPARETFGNKEH